MLMGEVNISTSVGPVRVAHDTASLLVVDHLWDGHTMSSIWDRQGMQIERRRVFAARTWWWTERALRLIQVFDAVGQLVTHRVDFASRPTRDGDRVFQTDWYLDLFVSGDGRRYVIDDEDELAQAVSQHLVTEEQADEAREQCAFLVRLVEDGSLAAWLETQCSTPFELALLPEAPHVWTYT